MSMYGKRRQDFTDDRYYEAIKIKQPCEIHANINSFRGESWLHLRRGKKQVLSLTMDEFYKLFQPKLLKYIDARLQECQAFIIDHGLDKIKELGPRTVEFDPDTGEMGIEGEEKDAETSAKPVLKKKPRSNLHSQDE